MQVTHNVVIIGAGFGGLGMAIRLKAQGEENILMIEKGHDVGGCWRDNTYPGAAASRRNRKSFPTSNTVRASTTCTGISASTRKSPTPATRMKTASGN
jgi:flavin-dependent dehydrogenase